MNKMNGTNDEKHFNHFVIALSFIYGLTELGYLLLRIL
ncbi:membrane protein [Bacillus subtilis]|nr:membrane protein [Bacillus subtilis]